MALKLFLIQLQRYVFVENNYFGQHFFLKLFLIQLRRYDEEIKKKHFFRDSTFSSNNRNLPPKTEISQNFFLQSKKYFFEKKIINFRAKMLLCFV